MLNQCLNIITYILFPLRFISTLTVVLLGLMVQIALFTWIKPIYIRRCVAFWSKIMLLCLGVNTRLNLSKTHDYFNASHPNALYVSNHLSWLDILIIQAHIPVVFVAKHSIKSWFVLGWLVSLAGTCFIDRSNRRLLKTIHNTITHRLQATEHVCFFPEGTTGDGLSILPFHSGLIQAAIDANVPVQPLCLRYSHTSPIYDKRSLMKIAIDIMLTHRLTAQLSILSSIAISNNNNLMLRTRQEITHEAYQAIVNEFNH